MIEILPDVGINPDWGLTHKPQFKVVEAAFGDGYEQRMADGINSVRRGWTVTWSDLSKRQVDLLYDFLIRMKGVYPFLWPVPDEDTMVQVVCKQAPQKVNVTWGTYALKASFLEDFTP